MKVNLSTVYECARTACLLTANGKFMKNIAKQGTLADRAAPFFGPTGRCAVNIPPVCGRTRKDGLRYD